MKRTIFEKFILAALLLGSASCASKGAAPVATVTDPYAAAPQPLTVTQCGQCHPGVFRNLKENGGRHQFQCQNCHQQLHAFNPVKNNWAEIMPKCSQCHEQPHGDKVTECLKCHSNPHTPRKVAMDATLTAACGQCHSGPAGDLAAFPSAHTQQGCAACHQAHGQIPSCLDCHEPHVTGQEVAACLGCHPAHKPLQVTYDTKADPATCGSCHDKVYGEWRATASKHGKVNCAECHTSHGFVPQCASCHGQPHDAALLKKFQGCLACHIDVHNLPVKKKGEGEKGKSDK
ncbi:MAG: hypothetical protein M0017_02515 [Desulfobacteraceae bacterium]|nr:hypothetical protein [Desulfobacteraceae bacterium]